MGITNSVKEIKLIKEYDNKNPGLADFCYRYVFSVFDYGTIIPPIPLDNSTICMMAGFNFELLKENGIDSHYQGLVQKENRQVISAKTAIQNRIVLDTMRVMLVHKLMPEYKNGAWNYSQFKDNKINNYVQPIEFISRVQLPESASVWKRIKKREITLKELGLSENLKPGDKLETAMLDYSTKFEHEDRYLSPSEAQNIMGINSERFDRINNTTRKASKIMTDYAASRGFDRLDGKVEYVTVYDKETQTQIDLLGDAVCTWHEDRLQYKGFGISKQRIRDEVKRLNQDWYGEIERAKEIARKGSTKDFRTLMNPKILYVSPSVEFFEKINTLFRAATNQWVEKKIYHVYSNKKDTISESLERAIEDLRK